MVAIIEARRVFELRKATQPTGRLGRSAEVYPSEASLCSFQRRTQLRHCSPHIGIATLAKLIVS